MKDKGTWLIIDPTGPFSGFSIAEKDSIIASKVFQSNFLFENLLKINDFFNSFNRVLGNVKGVILVNGPGSIMGLRIAFSWIKGFSQGRELKFKTVSSLDAIYFSNGNKKPCWTIMNSIRDDMFYSFNGGKPNVANKFDLLEMIKKKPGLCIGDYFDEISTLKNVNFEKVMLPQFEAIWIHSDYVEESNLSKSEPLIMYSFPIKNIE
ncbi:hypothetical protein CL643_02065 [bacterium]|nr:hypothetical protein [bacterium]